MNEPTRQLLAHIAKRPSPPQATALKAEFIKFSAQCHRWLSKLCVLQLAVTEADKPYSQMTHEEAEQAVNEAEAVLRADYFSDVRRLADSIKDELKNRLASGESGEPLREWLIERIEQDIDGHYNVIYTAASQRVLLFSDNSGAYAEDFGDEGIVDSGDIAWNKLAYAAMRRDVQEQLEANKIDLNDPDSDDTREALGLVVEV